MNSIDLVLFLLVSLRRESFRFSSRLGSSGLTGESGTGISPGLFHRPSRAAKKEHLRNNLKTCPGLSILIPDIIFTFYTTPYFTQNLELVVKRCGINTLRFSICVFFGCGHILLISSSLFLPRHDQIHSMFYRVT